MSWMEQKKLFAVSDRNLELGKLSWSWCPASSSLMITVIPQTFNYHDLQGFRGPLNIGGRPDEVFQKFGSNVWTQCYKLPWKMFRAGKSQNMLGQWQRTWERVLCWLLLLRCCDPTTNDRAIYSVAWDQSRDPSPVSTIPCAPLKQSGALAARTPTHPTALNPLSLPLLRSRSPPPFLLLPLRLKALQLSASPRTPSVLWLIGYLSEG